MNMNTLLQVTGTDDVDDYGVIVGLHFDVALVLDASDIEGDVTPAVFDRWGYRRAPVTVPAVETIAARADDYHAGEWADDYTFAAVGLAVAFESGDLSQADLIRAGDVLRRYASLLRAAGRDY